ncbi:nuclear transport factor 2 family protein [Sphingosinicella microcystinivorans]|uniref:Ketosteroid isomerase-like protein n=1 Tax=Sphingosinicella microcystinivorans TaxID=335406 RepID=A0AAD1D8H8_SPHMI|nr:nuclear transport factor 2 family protein [Sphingosinicella microcystinivorans]RKS86294.1 ketosteroid isomerase-like protein [Sphingosinicella microcystinivorans]BBE35660.1 hypothetical protein SmB9_33180 [Sphingosinicella microcystinivorans]
MAVFDANIAVAQKMYDIVRAGDFSKLDTIVTEDFEIVEADGLPFGGASRGRHALRELLERIIPILRPSDIKLKSITANENEVVGLLDLIFADGDGEFIMPVAEYFEIRDGHISRIVPYFFDTPGLTQFIARRG